MKIVIVGYGTMGHLLLSRIEEKEDLQCVGLIASSYYQEISELPQHPEVIVDVSHPDNFVRIQRAMERQPIPLVLATTGYSDDQKKIIESWARRVPIVMTSNFSIGMTIVNKMLKCCQREIGQYFDCDILEIHHEQKKDKPSGSALMLKKNIAGAGEGPVWLSETDFRYFPAAPSDCRRAHRDSVRRSRTDYNHAHRRQSGDLHTRNSGSGRGDSRFKARPVFDGRSAGTAFFTTPSE